MIFELLTMIELATVAQTCTIFQDYASDIFKRKLIKNKFIEGDKFQGSKVIMIFRQFGDLIVNLIIDESYFDWDDNSAIPLCDLAMEYCQPRPPKNNNYSLKTLNIRHVYDFQKINSLIRNFPRLESLEIEYCCMSKNILLIIKNCSSPYVELDSPIEPLIKTMTITNLSITKCKINTMWILNYLKLMPNLKTLVLKNKTNDETYNINDFHNLSYLIYLKKLKIHVNNQSPSPIFDTIKENKIQLEYLDISHGDLERLSIPTIESLRYLKLSECTSVSYEHTIQIYNNLKNLKDLRLSSTTTHMDLLQIKAVLRNLRELRYLKILTTNTDLRNQYERIIETARRERGNITISLTITDDDWNTIFLVAIIGGESEIVHDYEWI